MRTLTAILSVLAMVALVGCGGIINPAEDYGASQFFLDNQDGKCVLPDGSACLFGGGDEPPPGGDLPPDGEPPDGEPPDGEPPEELPPEEGGCWITGIGTFGKGNTRESGTITLRNVDNKIKGVRIYGGTGNISVD